VEDRLPFTEFWNPFSNTGLKRHEFFFRDNSEFDNISSPKWDVPLRQILGNANIHHFAQICSVQSSPQCCRLEAALKVP
jgi:hypothetical protein